MANETELALQIEDLKREHATLLRAARLLLALGVLVLAVVCGRSALTIPNMTDLFHDMLPGESLPASTRFVSRHPSRIPGVRDHSRTHWTWDGSRGQKAATCWSCNRSGAASSAMAVGFVGTAGTFFQAPRTNRRTGN